MSSLLGRELTADEQATEALLRNVLDTQEKRTVGASIQGIARSQPALFVAAAISMLDSQSTLEGRRSLYKQWLDCPQFLLELAHPDRFGSEQLLAVCRGLKEIDDLLDVQLGRLMPGRHEDTVGLAPDVVLRVLDVLDAISAGSRLILMLGHLTEHKDRRIASKATILVGKRVRNDNWVKRQLAAADPRVRANAVEALWGVDSPTARKCMWESLKDENNRVAGNALVGLHLLGEPAVGQLAQRMLQDARPTYRTTAAWAMGRIGGPEFVECLRQAAGDADQSVRDTARSALAGIEALTGTPLEKLPAPAEALQAQ
jgi:HEAT repeats